MFTFIGVYSSCFLFLVVVVSIMCFVAPFLCYFWSVVCLQQHFILYLVYFVVMYFVLLYFVY